MPVNYSTEFPSKPRLIGIIQYNKSRMKKTINGTSTYGLFHGRWIPASCEDVAILLNPVHRCTHLMLVAAFHSIISVSSLCALH